MRRLWSLVWLLGACTSVAPPPRYAVLHLHGTAYQRGLQHGQQLSSQIASFYTRMLTTSLVPYLGRQQADVAAVLADYGKPPYDTPNQFARRLLLESAQALEASIPAELRDEMHGIADGSGLPYDDVLVLNTFVDTTLAARAVTLFLQQTQAPTVVQVAAPAAATDARDQDDDGLTDEADEAALDFAPSATATWVELPTDASVAFVLHDGDGVDPASVHIDAQLTAVAGLPQTPVPIAAQVTTTGMADGDLRVVWQPQQPLPNAATVSLRLTASDLKVSSQPPPAHAHGMLPLQLTWTTVGAGRTRAQVANHGVHDGSSQPPAWAFGLRGQATRDGQPLVAHHFALLDAGVAHEHTVVQVHQPTNGPAFAVVGWAGVVYGMSGVNAHGVAMAVDHSDSLNNPMTQQFVEHLFQAKLRTSGTPIGMALRHVLQTAQTTDDAVALLGGLSHTFGWNVLLNDPAGHLKTMELHANILGDQPPLAFGPESHQASVGDDDLRMASHFVARPDDLQLAMLFEVKPQRFWTPYWQPSLRAWLDLGGHVQQRLGQFDVAACVDVLRQPELVDRHDSMTAVVIEPAARRLHVALGTVPATDAPFETWTLPGPP